MDHAQEAKKEMETACEFADERRHKFDIQFRLALAAIHALLEIASQLKDIAWAAGYRG